MSTIDDLRAIMSRFPETVETTWYGTTAFKAGGKGVCRFWGDRELERSGIADSEVLVLACEEPRAEMLAEAEPEVFFRTPHYRGSNWVLVQLAHIDVDDLEDMVEDAWRRVASPKLRKLRDAL